MICGRLDAFREELCEELEEELRDLALSLADEDAETAIAYRNVLLGEFDDLESFARQHGVMRFNETIKN